MARRFNLLFLISHDIGRRFGCYGDPNAYTPAIDRFARTALRFDGHYCQWPLCGPSRASLFTGCRPLTIGRYNNQPFFAPYRERTGYKPATLPEAFRIAGYQTKAFGFLFHDAVDEPSWSGGHLQVAQWADDDPEFSHVPTSLLAGWRSRGGKELVRKRWERLAASGVKESDLTDPVVARAARGPAIERFDGPDSCYPDGVVTDKVVDWLGNRHTAPFFCAVGLVAGHTPFRAPATDWDRYDPLALRLPANRKPPVGTPEWVVGDSEPAQFYTTQGYSLPWSATEAESLQLLHGHLATITYTDRQIGRILCALEQAGLDDSTIVVITSDHGFSDGEHGYWGKHNCWERSFQVPLLIRVPAGSEGFTSGGRATHALTEHIDLFPTLCELCNLSLPLHIEGSSFLSVFNAPDQGHKDAVFASRKPMWHDRLQVYDLARTVRTDRYRFTGYMDENGATLYEELFDYLLDPQERENVARHDSYRSIREELVERLTAAK